MTKKELDFINNMSRYRGMDFVRLGMLVEVGGNIGTIIGMNSSSNLDVIFANRLKMGTHKHNCHPTWDIAYFDAEGNIIKDFRNKRG